MTTPGGGSGGGRDPIDFASLVQALHGDRAEHLVAQWLPGGTMRGHEYVCGSLSGGKGSSCSVNLGDGPRRGMWADFSTDEKGKDLLSLYAAVRGLKPGPAARELIEQLRLGKVTVQASAPTEPDGRPAPPADGNGVRRKRDWQPVVPVPPHAPEPTFRHHYRKPEDLVASWAYRFEGELYGHVVRFRTSDGGKDLLPHTWCTDVRDARGLSKWHWMQFPEPRPLYVPATLLSGDLSLPVVIVEGEKCADAGHKLLGHEFDFVSWPGGGKAWPKAAWRWLMGRTVFAWPDWDAKREPLTKAERDAGVDPASKPLLPEAEQPGMAAMVGILATLAREHGCTVHLCPIGTPAAAPADGWDIADAVAEGWDAARVRDFIRSAREFTPPEDLPTQRSAGTSPPTTRSAGGDSGGGGAGEPPAPPDDAYGDESPAWWSRRQFERKRLADCRENVFLYLTNQPELKGLVAYDEFAHRVTKQRVPPWKSEVGEWTTNDDYLLGLYLAENCGLRIKSETTLVQGVAMAAWHSSYHPVKQWFAQLPAWDGTPRLRHWLHECLGAADNEYTALVGTWFVMGMCKRVLEPGSQMDYMVVLEGLEGKQKSTALRVLAIRDEWFSDTPVKIGSPDALLSLAGKLLTEIGELESFNKAEATAILMYVSSRVDRVREPYARRHVDRPRSGVLSGTTNAGEYIRGLSGWRRFWPVACDGEIDLAKLRAWLQQLYAEALHRLASDDLELRRYWPTREETTKYLEPEQQQREVGDPWFERIAVWVDSKAQFGESTHEVHELESLSVSEILAHCLRVPIDRIDGARQMATRVGTCMTRLGWHKRRDPRGARLWRYHRPAKGPQPGAADGSAVGVVGAAAEDPRPQPEGADDTPF